MKKDSYDKSISSELLQKYVLPNEPALSTEEKQEMWNAIQKRTQKQPQRLIRPWNWKWYAAASVLIAVIGSLILIQSPFHKDPYARMAKLVNVDTLNYICLYIDEQQIELTDQVEIRCLAASNQVEILTSDNSSFKLTAPNQKETYLQVAVPAGKKASIVLADQSRISVREQTKFSFPLKMAGEKRKVHLEGEAYMQIAHQPERHFITETKELNVTVLGTEFLVSAYPNQTEQSVLLISGRVEVCPTTGEKLILSPNERYVYNSNTHESILDKHVDATQHTIWKENMLTIENEPLSNVLKQIEAIYRTDFNYDWNKLEKVKISGKLDVSVPLNELLLHLSKITPIQIDYKQKKITINNNP